MDDADGIPKPDLQKGGTSPPQRQDGQCYWVSVLTTQKILGCNKASTVIGLSCAVFSTFCSFKDVPCLTYIVLKKL